MTSLLDRLVEVNDSKDEPEKRAVSLIGWCHCFLQVFQVDVACIFHASFSFPYGTLDCGWLSYSHYIRRERKEKPIITSVTFYSDRDVGLSNNAATTGIARY